MPTPCIIHCQYSPTYENPRGFSIRFVFAKLVAETRNEIIHKHVVGELNQDKLYKQKRQETEKKVRDYLQRENTVFRLWNPKIPSRAIARFLKIVEGATCEDFLAGVYLQNKGWGFWDSVKGNRLFS